MFSEASVSHSVQGRRCLPIGRGSASGGTGSAFGGGGLPNSPTAVVSMHPTGMHSCFSLSLIVNKLYIFRRPYYCHNNNRISVLRSLYWAATSLCKVGGFTNKFNYIHYSVDGHLSFTVKILPYYLIIKERVHCS